MPMLKNQRHERFAQGVASGLNSTQAYIQAGFKETGARANAARLIAVDSVRDRVDELKPKVISAIEQRGIFTKERVMNRLDELSREAQALGQISAANRAEELLGKELGMFVDRVESKSEVEITDTNESREQLNRRIAGLVSSGDPASGTRLPN